ncbi:hypothetical protein [Microcoleus vaginatus]
MGKFPVLAIYRSRLMALLLLFKAGRDRTATPADSLYDPKVRSGSA